MSCTRSGAADCPITPTRTGSTTCCCSTSPLPAATRLQPYEPPACNGSYCGWVQGASATTCWCAPCACLPNRSCRISAEMHRHKAIDHRVDLHRNFQLVVVAAADGLASDELRTEFAEARQIHMRLAR